jgi:hypothetical protein
MYAKSKILLVIYVHSVLRLPHDGQSRPAYKSVYFNLATNERSTVGYAYAHISFLIHFVAACGISFENSEAKFAVSHL